EIFGRIPAYAVKVCSERPRVRTGFVTLTVPHRLDALARAHTIFVPGTEHPFTATLSPAELRALRKAVKRGARLASICTGAFLAARTGALDGREATTHWRGAAELARRHPRITVKPDVLYVDEGEVLTSAGAAAGLDLCLHVVRKDLGAQMAARAA